MEAAQVQAPVPSRAISTILRAGLVAGTMDITAALVVYTHSGAERVRLLQRIASGLLGKASYQGGQSTAWLGLLCHFAIAMSWAAIYFAASRRIRFLLDHPVVSGRGVRSRRLHHHESRRDTTFEDRPDDRSCSRGRLIAAGILVVCIGLPIALITRRFSGPSSSSAT